MYADKFLKLLDQFDSRSNTFSHHPDFHGT
jgi:hypothetical protein